MRSCILWKSLRNSSHGDEVVQVEGVLTSEKYIQLKKTSEKYIASLKKGKPFEKLCYEFSKMVLLKENSETV